MRSHLNHNNYSNNIVNTSIGSPKSQKANLPYAKIAKSLEKQKQKQRQIHKQQQINNNDQYILNKHKNKIKNNNQPSSSSSLIYNAIMGQLQDQQNKYINKLIGKSQKTKQKTKNLKNLINQVSKGHNQEKNNSVSIYCQSQEIKINQKQKQKFKQKKQENNYQKDAIDNNYSHYLRNSNDLEEQNYQNLNLNGNQKIAIAANRQKQLQAQKSNQFLQKLDQVNLEFSEQRLKNKINNTSKFYNKNLHNASLNSPSPSDKNSNNNNNNIAQYYLLESLDNYLQQLECLYMKKQNENIGLSGSKSIPFNMNMKKKKKMSEFQDINHANTNHNKNNKSCYHQFLTKLVIENKNQSQNQYPSQEFNYNQAYDHDENQEKSEDYFENDNDDQISQLDQQSNHNKSQNKSKQSFSSFSQKNKEQARQKQASLQENNAQDMISQFQSTQKKGYYPGYNNNNNFNTFEKKVFKNQDHYYSFNPTLENSPRQFCQKSSKKSQKGQNVNCKLQYLYSQPQMHNNQFSKLKTIKKSETVLQSNKKYSNININQNIKSQNIFKSQNLQQQLNNFHSKQKNNKKHLSSTVDLQKMKETMYEMLSRIRHLQSQLQDQRFLKLKMEQFLQDFKIRASIINNNPINNKDKQKSFTKMIVNHSNENNNDIFKNNINNQLCQDSKQQRKTNKVSKNRKRSTYKSYQSHIASCFQPIILNRCAQQRDQEESSLMFDFNLHQRKTASKKNQYHENNQKEQKNCNKIKKRISKKDSMIIYCSNNEIPYTNFNPNTRATVTQGTNKNINYLDKNKNHHKNSSKKNKKNHNYHHSQQSLIGQKQKQRQRQRQKINYIQVPMDTYRKMKQKNKMIISITNKGDFIKQKNTKKIKNKVRRVSSCNKAANQNNLITKSVNYYPSAKNINPNFITNPYPFINCSSNGYPLSYSYNNTPKNLPNTTKAVNSSKIVDANLLYEELQKQSQMKNEKEKDKYYKKIQNLNRFYKYHPHGNQNKYQFHYHTNSHDILPSKILQFQKQKEKEGETLDSVSIFNKLTNKQTQYNVIIANTLTTTSTNNKI